MNSVHQCIFGDGYGVPRDFLVTISDGHLMALGLEGHCMRMA
jgi:hypothetical protein